MKIKLFFSLTLMVIAIVLSETAYAKSVLIEGNIDLIVPLTYTDYLDDYPAIFFSERQEEGPVGLIGKVDRIVLTGKRYYKLADLFDGADLILPVDYLLFGKDFHSIGRHAFRMIKDGEYRLKAYFSPRVSKVVKEEPGPSFHDVEGIVKFKCPVKLEDYPLLKISYQLSTGKNILESHKSRIFVNKRKTTDLSKREAFTDKFPFKVEEPENVFSVGLDLNNDGNADAVGYFGQMELTEIHGWTEELVGVKRLLPMSKRYYLFDRMLGWFRDTVNWHVREHNLRHEFISQKDELAVRLLPGKKKAGNAWLQLEKQIGPIDLRKFPYLGYEYYVDDPTTQYIELVARIDFDGDNAPEGVVKEIYPTKVNTAPSLFYHNILKAAESRFPGKKRYCLVSVGINLWQSNLTNEAEVRFHLLNVSVFNYQIQNILTGQNNLEYFPLRFSDRYEMAGRTTARVDLLEQTKKVFPDASSFRVLYINGRKALKEATFVKQEEESRIRLPGMPSGMSLIKEKGEPLILYGEDTALSLREAIKVEDLLPIEAVRVYPSNLLYTFKLDEEGWTVSIPEAQSGNVSVDVNTGLVALKTDSQFSILYRVDDSQVQTIGVIVGLKTYDQERDELELIEEYPITASKDWQEFRFNIYEKAEEQFPELIKRFKMLKGETTKNDIYISNIRLVFRVGLLSRAMLKPTNFFVKKLSVQSQYDPRHNIKFCFDSKEIEKKVGTWPVSDFLSFNSLNAKYNVSKRFEDLGIKVEFNGSPMEDEGAYLSYRFPYIVDLPHNGTLYLKYKMEEPDVLEGRIYLNIDTTGNGEIDKRILFSRFSSRVDTYQQITCDLSLMRELLRGQNGRLIGIDVGGFKKDGIDAREVRRGKYTIWLKELGLRSSDPRKIGIDEFLGKDHAGRKVLASLKETKLIKIDNQNFSLGASDGSNLIQFLTKAYGKGGGWIDFGKWKMEKGKHWLRYLKNPYFDLKLVSLKEVKNKGNPISAEGGINIDFKKINPTRYVVSVKTDSDRPFWLVFSESFHEGWKAFLRSTQSCKSRVHSEEPWAALWSAWKDRGRRIELREHNLVNGYANAWWIEPKRSDFGRERSEIKRGKSQREFEVVLEYKPQRLFEIGLIVSGLTLIGCISYLIFYAIRRRKREKT